MLSLLKRYIKKITKGEEIVIFLDIDGVLNRSENVFIYNNIFAPKLEEENIKLFNSLLDDYNIKIVLHSSWICENSIENMNKYFKYKGINQSIYDYVDINLEKQEAIKKYVEENNIKKYIVFEDDEEVLKYFDNEYKIQTYNGLKFTDIEKFRKVVR